MPESKNKPKKVIISVINDLATDQRVARVCYMLTEMGFTVMQVGRILPTSPPLPERPWEQKRMRLLFRKGPLFYAEFNLRLLIFLLFHKADLLVANDLDTLLPNFIIHKIRRLPLVYDSHEFFTETPEVIHRPLVRGVWLTLEKLMLPRLPWMITVNESLAEIFSRKYGIEVLSVRNVPPLRSLPIPAHLIEKGIPEGKNVLILQGSGINIHRGAEEVVEAMRYIDDAVLLVIGSGDVIEQLKEQAKQEGVAGKVFFFPRMPVDKLATFTAAATIGLSVDKDICPNYHFSLPNKLFDYIHAGTPVLASNLPEVRKVVEGWQVGRILPGHEPRVIADALKEMLADREALRCYRQNCLKAREELNWEKEKLLLQKRYEAYL
ncbi:MAG: glycosyltransferase [Bacteroidales bacterium]